MKVAHTAIMMILGILVPLMMQLWDQRRLSAEQRAQGWNFASWGAALYAFGPASMLGWVFVTRRKWWRVLVAPLWFLPPMFLLWLADGLLSWGLERQAMEVDAVELATAAGVAAVGASLVMVIAELIALIWGALRGKGDDSAAG